MDPPIRVLFLCTGNSARSQMAEALLGNIGGARYEAQSAGIQPAGVHPLTVRVLEERGIDSRDARSTGLESCIGKRYDHVITVCDRARQACPTLPGARPTHWDLEDPAAVLGDEATRLQAFERIADEVEARVRAFVASLDGATAADGGR